MMSTSYGAIAPSLPPLRQQLLHPFTVGLEADDHLAVDHQRGRRPAFPLIDQLVIGVRVRLDVLALRPSSVGTPSGPPWSQRRDRCFLLRRRGIVETPI